MSQSEGEENEEPRLSRNQLFELLYGELRRMARLLKLGDHSRTMSPTALVNELYLRLEGTFIRKEFMGVAAETMRRILVEAARARHAQKRGGGVFFVTLGDEASPTKLTPEDVITLDQALQDLASSRARHARIVELHWFVGMTFKEIADELGVDERTVYRDWKFARAWLNSKMSGLRCAEQGDAQNEQRFP